MASSCTQMGNAFFLVGLDVCVSPSDFMLVKDKGQISPRLVHDNHDAGNSTANFYTRIFSLSHAYF